MLCFPSAKINLGLSVLSKRPDAYHSIESLLYPIQLVDILEIIENQDRDEFTLSGLSLEIPIEQNIVLKTLKLLRSHYSFPKVKIHLHKQIPSGAGLGGGSSDAAHTLLTINKLFQLAISRKKLKDLASQIGSDCPFFIDSAPQYASSRGEILEPFELNLKPLKLLLIIPDFSISTEFAYSKIKIEKHIVLPKDALNQPIKKWRQLLKNDFEISIFAKFPELNHLKENLYLEGAIYASMSGSGSAIYGLFSDEIVVDLPINYQQFWLDFPA